MVFRSWPRLASVLLSSSSCGALRPLVRLLRVLHSRARKACVPCLCVRTCVLVCVRASVCTCAETGGGFDYIIKVCLSEQQ